MTPKMPSRFALLGAVAFLVACGTHSADALLDQSVDRDDQMWEQEPAAQSQQGHVTVPYPPPYFSSTSDGPPAPAPSLLRFTAGEPISEPKGTYYPVELNESAAIESRTSGSLTIVTPSGELLNLTHRMSEDYPDGNWTWFGNAPGGRVALITFGATATFGKISATADSPSFSIVTRSGKTWLVEEGPVSEFTRDNYQEDTLIPPQPASRAAPTLTQRPALGFQKTRDALDLAATDSIIDLLVAYSAEFAEVHGGVEGAITRIRYLIDVSNLAYTASGLNVSIRLVAAVRVNYSNSISNSDALRDLTGLSGWNASSELHRVATELRDRYGADLVTLVRPFSVNDHVSCGNAWLNGYNGRPITVHDAAYGFSTVSDGVDPGGRYYCRDRTLAHEIGHNLGSNHDPENSAERGLYPYSYGYKTSEEAGNFFTIMAYGDDDQNEAISFSDPELSDCWGHPCGDLFANNALSIAQAATVVATFRTPIQLFDDVQPGHWAYDEIYRVSASGVTGGCTVSPLRYCPDRLTLRDETSAFLLRSLYGIGFTPPSPSGLFEDVPTSYWAAGWIELLAEQRLASGCSSVPRLFCPRRNLNRAEMAVFLLRAKYGSAYQPPAATGLYDDVPTTHWAADWIEALAAERITGGCSASPARFCPERPVRRDEMAVFLTRAFNL